MILCWPFLISWHLLEPHCNYMQFIGRAKNLNRKKLLNQFITEAIIDISYNGSKEFAKDKCMFLLCSLVYEHLSNSLKYIPFLSFVQLCSNTQHTEHKNYKTIMNEHSGCCSMPRVGCSILSVVGSATQGYFEYVSI